MNLSSKSRKLHCILIIHVKDYLQTRTIAILLCAWQCNNIAPAIRRRTYCCRSVVSVGSRKSTQERAIRLLNVGKKDGKASSENPGPNYGASIVGITTREDGWALRIWNVIEGWARYRRPHAPARHGGAFIAGVLLFLPGFVNVTVAHLT